MVFEWCPLLSNNRTWWYSIKEEAELQDSKKRNWFHVFFIEISFIYWNFGFSLELGEPFESGRGVLIVIEVIIRAINRWLSDEKSADRLRACLISRLRIDLRQPYHAFSSTISGQVQRGISLQQTPKIKKSSKFQEITEKS